MTFLKKILWAFAVVAAGAAPAATTPVMVSLVAPVQVPDGDHDVAGFRLSLIYGDCRGFKGLDIGLAGHADGDFSGLAVGGANIVDERLCGVQLGVANWNGNIDTSKDGRSIGVQVGILDFADSFCGLQLGGLNYADTFVGWQDGFVNISGRSLLGLQSGFVNYADDVNGLQCGDYLLLGVNMASGAVHGCQIGIVNYAERIDGGCQIGIVNIIERNGWMPVFPFVNWGF